MGTDLRARANSAFVAVSAYTRPRKSKPKIYVYVEDDIDKAFEILKAVVTELV